MSDEADIQRLINSYSQLASRGDFAQASQTWVPEGVWAIPHLGLRIEGRDQVRATLEAFADAMEYVLQLNTPALIDIAGDTATATSSIRECGASKGKLEGFEFLGIYEDELVRTPEGWRFTVRTFRGIGTQYFPLISAQAH